MPSKRQLAPLLTWEVLPPPIPGDLVLPYDLPEDVEDEVAVSKVSTAAAPARADCPSRGGGTAPIALLMRDSLACVN